MSRLRFLIILTCVAVLTTGIPFDLKDAPLMAKGLTTSAAVAITGNSVLTHASKCDQDPRSITRMLADDTSQSALDLSFPGQSIDESVTLAATALRNPHIQTVIVPVSAFALQEWDTDPIRLYALSRLIDPDLPMAGLAERAASPGRLSGAAYHSEAPFDYDGQHYPVYDVVKSSYLDTEKTAMTCPENDGSNVRFITAIYYHNYLEYPTLQADIALIASLRQEAVRRRKTLLVTLLPIDHELVDRLRINGGTALRRQAADIVDAFAAAGVDVLDLSDAVPNSDFADRWCACGHLLASGRAKVAERMAQGLPTSVRTAAAH